MLIKINRELKIIFVLVLIAAYIVIWKFNLTDVNERRIWDSKRTYHLFLRKKYRFFIEKYGVAYWVVVFSLYCLSIKQKYIISILLFTIAFVFIQFQNYSQQQQVIMDIKWFDIVITEEGKYVVLGQNGELMQLNRCYIEKNTLFINLDEVMLRKINNITYKTIYVEKFEKICNGAVCTEHFKIGYRKDFKKI